MQSIGKSKMLPSSGYLDQQIPKNTQYSNCLQYCELCATMSHSIRYHFGTLIFILCMVFTISSEQIMLHGKLVQVSCVAQRSGKLLTKSGISIHKYFKMKPQNRSVLYQEVQALALKSSQLRRMDFSNCLPRRRPKDTFDVEGEEVGKDPGCEIVAALLPLCRAKLTEVSWIILNGIELGETDFDDMRMFSSRNVCPKLTCSSSCSE